MVLHATFISSLRWLGPTLWRWFRFGTVTRAFEFMIRQCALSREKQPQKSSWYPLRMTTARVLDERAKQLAQHLLQTEAQVLSTLMEMNRTRAFAELNYSGVYDYCLRRLGFSKDR